MKTVKMTAIRTRYTTAVPVNRSGGLKVNSLGGLSRTMQCQRQPHSCLFHRNVLPNTLSVVVQEQFEEGLCCAAGVREESRGRGGTAGLCSPSAGLAGTMAHHNVQVQPLVDLSRLGGCVSFISSLLTKL